MCYTNRHNSRCNNYYQKGPCELSKSTRIFTLDSCSSCISTLSTKLEATIVICNGEVYEKKKVLSGFNNRTCKWSCKCPQYGTYFTTQYNINGNYVKGSIKNLPLLVMVYECQLNIATLI